MHYLKRGMVSVVALLIVASGFWLAPDPAVGQETVVKPKVVDDDPMPKGKVINDENMQPDSPYEKFEPIVLDPNATPDDPNPRIDCKTSPPAPEFKPLYKEFHNNGVTDCRVCHVEAQARTGRGDRPQLNQGVVVVQNHLQEEVEYDIKVGSAASKWYKRKLPARTAVKYTFPYQRAGQNKSLKYWLNYKGDSRAKGDRKMTLVATPTTKLGNVYWLARDASNPSDSKVYLYNRARAIYR